MEIAKPPPIDNPTGGNPTPTMPEHPAQPAPAQQPAIDRADIRPLDVPAALQILIAEVLDAWRLAPLHGAAQSPVEAANRLVEIFIQSLPNADDEARGWTAALAALQSGLESGTLRAMAVVGAWPDVPQAAVEALKEAHATTLAVLGDEPVGSWLMRPEWLGLAPRIEIFRRRRRAARRRLIDPDFPVSSPEDEIKP